VAQSTLNRLNSIAQLTPDELRLLIALGPGSFVLASTIGTINVGLPAIQDDFDVSLSALKWVSIMGSIMMASMSLCFGRIGDIVGRRRVYKAGMLVYAVFSGLAAVCFSFESLMLVRVFMAMGVAMSLPLGIAIAAGSCRPERRGQIIGLLASCTAAGQLAGPSLGGLALDINGWRGIFVANLILAGICFLLQQVLLRGDDEKRKQSFDFPGAVLLLLGYPALLIGLSLGPGEGWTSDVTLAAFAFSALGLLAFGIWELKFPAPIFRFSFFKSLSFCVAMFTLVVASFTQQPVTLFTPIYLQRVLHVTPITVGFLMMALPISTLIAGPIGGRLADKNEPRYIAALGALVTFLAILAYSRLGTATPVLFILLPLVLLGIGSGLFRPANQVAVFAGVSAMEYGSLSAMLQSLGALAGTLGTTITVAINDAHSSSSTDAVAFADAQHVTFTALLPLLLISAFVSLLGRSPAPKREPAATAAEPSTSAGS
jgi:EmrB/QacA subfamily drug resistance transporter